MNDSLKLFGAPTLQYGPQSEPVPLDWQVPVALLAYLGCKPGWHSRESIAALFRPQAGVAEGRAYLRRLIHRTRETMPMLASLEVEDSRIRWNGGCDVRRFDEAAALADWRQAAALQSSGLLEEMGSIGVDALDEWFAEERQRLRQKLGAALKALMGRAREQGEDGAAWMRRLATLDPLDEDAVLFMLSQTRTPAERREADAAFQTLARRLAAEWQRSPEPRTLQAHAALNRVEISVMPSREPRDAQAPTVFTAAAPLGREAELEALQQLMAAGRARLVTLHGWGGVGKTLLARALHAAEQANGTACAWVDLLPADSAHAMLDAIAAALGVPAREGSLEDQLADWLAARSILVFLDNFEQLKAHAPLLSRLLEAAAGLRFVVTSREALRLPQEYSFALQGLDWKGADSAAAQLFGLHARRLGSVLSPVDQPHVAELAAFLEGVPLAIELAANWVTLISPAVLLAELRNDPAFIDAAQPGAPASRSMRSVFSAAWKRLAQTERDALASLAVVLAAMSLDAARAVSASDAGVLLRLVDKSLLQRSAGNRFRLHPLVREFARAQVDAQVLEQARHRHANYFLTYLAQPPALRIGQYAPERVEQLLPQAEDIAEAWRTAVDAGRWDLVAAASPNFLGFLFMASRYEDAQELATRVLHKLAANHPFAATFASFRSLAAFRLGHVDEAEAVVRDALALQPQGGGLVLLLLAQSRIHRFRGRAAQALAAAQQGFETLGEADVFVRMRVAEDIALCHWILGDASAAERHLLANLTLAKQSDAPFVEARALCLLGFIKEAAGSPGEALKLMESAVAIFARMNDVYQIALCRRGMSYAFAQLGDVLRQQQAAQDALEEFTSSGYRLELGESLLAVALAHDAAGRRDDALQTCRQALRLCVQADQTTVALSCIAALGTLLAASDRLWGLALVSFALNHSAWRKSRHPVIEERQRLLAMTAEELALARRQAAGWTLDYVCSSLIGTPVAAT